MSKVEIRMSSTGGEVFIDGVKQECVMSTSFSYDHELRQMVFRMKRGTLMPYRIDVVKFVPTELIYSKS